MKELYLYSPIYDFVAESLITAIEESMGSDISLRITSSGGNIFANYGICAKMIEHGAVNVKVDGCAMSSAANLLFYAKNVDCLDVSKFILHRADMYVENDADQKFLDEINKDLKSKMLQKIDPVIFKEVTGNSIDDMFDPKQRIEISLNAKQAKKIGLVNKIKTLSPAEVEAFTNKMFAVAAENPIPKKEVKMTIEKLKSEHPEVYAAIFGLGVTAGITKEKERVEACLVFHEIDAAGVITAIKSGKDLNAVQMSEFALKAGSKNEIAAIVKDSNGNIITDAASTVAKTEKEKQVEAFAASAKSHLKN